MKEIKSDAAQGDCYIRRIKRLPEGAKEVAPEDGRVIVAHSETGHHHYLHAEGVRFYEHKNPLLCYLAIEGPHADLIHARPFDTHETLRIPHGIFEVRRQREPGLAPGEWTMVAD